MPSVTIQCPAEGCEYITPEAESAVALQLLTIHGYSHAPKSVTQKQQQLERPKRPKIDMGCTSERWSYFKSRWVTYKKLTNLEGDATDQLLECCEEELKLALFRAHSDKLQGKTESDVLEAIEKLAVEPEKEIVERVRLLNMRQDRDELVQSFVTRLRGQANMCRFVLKHKCTCNLESDVSYSDLIVRDVLARGIADADIQVELLGTTNQGMSLEETVEFIKTKESGKASASHLSETLTANAVRSSYKRTTKANQPHAVENWGKGSKGTPCSYCGKAGHGDCRRRVDRKGICPAYGHRCNKCGIEHHFDHVCRKATGKTSASAIDTDHENFLLATQDGPGTTLQKCDTVNHD